MKVPKSWKSVILADVAAREPNAIVDGPFGSNLKLSDYVPDGVPVLQGKNITGNKFQWFDVRFISEEKANSLKRSFARVGDILIVKIGSIGYSAKIDDLQGYPHALIPANLCKVTPNPDVVDTSYLVYFLNAKPSVDYLTKNASATSQPALSLSKVKELPILLPPLPEQRRIASILDRADRLRRLRRYAAQLSDSFLQAVFIEMFGEYIHHDIGTSFQDMLVMPLQNGFFETNDKYGSGTPVVWVDNLYHTLEIDTTNLRRVRIDEETIAKYEVAEGDLLFTRSSLVREGVGQVNIVPELKEKMMFESHIIRARVDRSKVNPYFVLELYRSNFGRSYIMRTAHTSTMTTIQQDTINDLPCPLPPLPLQEKFARIVQQFDRLRAQQREAERQAEQLFQALLHAAFA